MSNKHDSALHDLWYGNINPLENGDSDSPQMRKTFSLLCKCREQLLACLTEEQQALLISYENQTNEYLCLAQEAAFFCGFRIGLRLTTDALYP